MEVFMKLLKRAFAKKDLLKLYRPGCSFLVKSLDHSNKASKKLIDMGITPDTTIYIDGAAPLGEPLVVKVRDYKVALRSGDLNALEVELQNDCVLNELRTSQAT